MTVARILVPVRGDGKGENVLTHASVLARRFNAHIEVVHTRARPEDMMPAGVVIPSWLRKQLNEASSQVADAEESNLHEKFEALMQRLGMQVVPETELPPANVATACWHERKGKQVDVIKRWGAQTDMVFVAKPDRDRNLGVNSLKAGLFATGRPVVMCPPTDTAPASLGSKVAVAWNGALEASRAVAMSMPILRAADSVTVLDGGSGGLEKDTASAEALVRYLAIHGIAAERREIKAGSNPGAVLLKNAAEIGADLLVMGAYGHSHERETVFGGATQHIVDTATLPVLMVH